jgi:hypothetical protein
MDSSKCDALLSDRTTDVASSREVEKVITAASTDSVKIGVCSDTISSIPLCQSLAPKPEVMPSAEKAVVSEATSVTVSMSSLTRILVGAVNLDDVHQKLILPCGILSHVDLSLPIELAVDDRLLSIPRQNIQLFPAGLRVLLTKGCLPEDFANGPSKPFICHVQPRAQNQRTQVISVELTKRDLTSSLLFAQKQGSDVSAQASTVEKINCHSEGVPSLKSPVLHNHDSSFLEAGTSSKCLENSDQLPKCDLQMTSTGGSESDMADIGAMESPPVKSTADKMDVAADEHPTDDTEPVKSSTSAGTDSDIQGSKPANGFVQSVEEATDVIAPVDALMESTVVELKELISQTAMVSEVSPLETQPKHNKLDSVQHEESMDADDRS